ncbi:MAG: TraR/DksA C4-type zinc finger protein [bacterium]|nr:TraR/DksA C4-type zinc finger protein [bacterium]
MTHLDTSFVESQKSHLQEELERVTLDLGNMSDKGGAKYEDMGSDEESNAQEVAQFDESVDATQQLRMLRDELEAALGRIEVGNYGICEQCKAEIPNERLEASPSARTCMACAGT